MQANRIGLPHLEHGRIPISARLYNGFRWTDDIMLPLCWAGALPISLSPITACSDGDGASLAQCINTALVNFDHYWKFGSQKRPQCGDTEAIHVGCLGRGGDPCSLKIPDKHLFRRVIRW
jgi:hypothetical protein